jgi:hypothetical protein
MIDPFARPSNLTPQQWKFRARVIQAHLDRLSIDELMRGGRVGEPPHLGVQGPHRRGYDPNQPRVPAGHPDGGQWTDDERLTDDRWAHRRSGALQLAAAERPPLSLRDLALFVARKLIEAIRRELASWDLFGEHHQDTLTVAVTTIDGREIHGTSSEFGDWRAIDYVEARKLRAIILRKNPHLAKGRALGQMPLNAFFHAETSVLLRAARQHGGSLAGRTLDVFVDDDTCNNCQLILGHVGLELGNPTVTFINSISGRIMGVVRDGKWNPR